MIGNSAVVNTLKNAYGLYRSAFKVCFVFAVILAAITESFKVLALQSGIDKMAQSYLEEGVVPTHLQASEALLWVGLLSIVATVIVNAMIICIGGEMFKAQAKFCSKDNLNASFSMFRSRIGLFIVVSVLNGILWVLVSMLSVFGIWIISSFTLILFPTVLLGGMGVVATFRENFRLLGSNALYALQLGFVLMLILFAKYVLYAIFSAAHAGDVGFGIEHVVIIFIEALLLPFSLMIMVAAFFELNAKDDMPVR